MKHFCIDVTECNGEVTKACVHMALGPWPLKNWSHIGILCGTVERAKELIAQLEAIPDCKLRYDAFVYATIRGVVNLNEVEKHRAEQKYTRKYRLYRD